MEKVLKALENNNIEAHYFKTKGEICEFITKILPLGATIASGGSQSLIDSGVFELINSEKYKFIDRFAAKTPKEEKQMKAEYLTADYFFCSSNAVTKNGELINVDGRSNRVAAILYGPQNVIMVVGKNKIVENIEEGLLRVKKIAAPKNTVRLNCATFCKEKGYCVAVDNAEMATGCQSEARICCNYVISSHQREKGRIKVLICEEELGF